MKEDANSYITGVFIFFSNLEARRSQIDDCSISIPVLTHTMRLQLLTIALAASTVSSQSIHDGHNHGGAIKSLLSKILNRPSPTKPVLPSSKPSGIFTILPVPGPSSIPDPHAGHDVDGTMTILPIFEPSVTSDPHAGHGSVPAPTASAPSHDDGHGGHATPSGAVTAPETVIPPGFLIEPDLDPKKPATPGSRIIEQRFGPYKLAAGKAKNFFASAKMPCTNCWITAAQGILEYADGTEANINTGVSHPRPFLLYSISN